MSKPGPNSFFETDFSKFMDMSKMMGEFKMPNFSAEAWMASCRRNMEVLAAVNQATFETAQALTRRQAELMRQGFEEATSLMNAVMSSETPEEKVMRHAEISKGAVDKCLANAREIADTVTKSNYQAMETLSNRMNEGLEELRDIVKTSKAA